jgi:opacity protein-like surface antigen
MKKLILLSIVLIFTGFTSASAQDKEVAMNKKKNNQAELPNDFFISYGTGTVYYFVENNGMSANSMSGTFLAGFSRSINKVIAVGFQLSYTNIGRSETVSNNSYPNPSYYSNTATDNLWQGIANIRFRYLNTPSFCMYSGIGMGVTMDYYSKTDNSTTSKGQKLLPAGQLTLLGFRVGRAISFFGEFGLGTNSIINAGISFKFSD